MAGNLKQIQVVPITSESDSAFNNIVYSPEENSVRCNFKKNILENASVGSKIKVENLQSKKSVFMGTKSSKVEKCLKESKELLPVSDYEFWFRTLIEGNTESASDMLQNSIPKGKKRLINGKFDGDNLYIRNCLQKPGNEGDALFVLVKSIFPQKIVCPITLAVLSKSVPLLKELLSHHPKLTDVVEDGNNNIFHMLVLFAAFYASDELIFCEMYHIIERHLSQNGKLDHLEKILLSDNQNGLRPLELAGRLRRYRLGNSILNTRNVYKIIQDSPGLAQKHLYDITDYVGSKARRRFCSALYTVLLLEHEHLDDHLEHISSSSVLHTWCSLHIQQTKCLLLTWAFLRTVYCLLFLILSITFDRYIQQPENNLTAIPDNSSYNTTMIPVEGGISWKDAPTIFNVFVITATVLNIRWLVGVYAEVYDMVLYLKIPKIIRSNITIQYVVNTAFFRFCDTVHQVCARQLCGTLVYEGYFPRKPYTLFLISAATITNIWSVLFFLQITPFLGHFVIVFQNMVRILFKFLIIYLVIFVSFTSTFQILMKRDNPEDYGNFFTALFVTFLNMLNIVDESSFRNDSPESLPSILVYISYIIVVPILLLNFLIALMSDAVAYMSVNKSIVLKLYRLEISLTTENKIRTFFPAYLCDKILTKGLHTLNDRLYLVIEKTDRS